MKNGDARQPQLGPLETQLLGVLSQRKDATVRELLALGDVQGAYTTVMTTLDRLYKKGFLDRVLDGRNQAFRYRLKQGEREFYRAALGEHVSRVLQSVANPALPVSFLVDAVTEHDTALLDELRRAVNRKRQQLRRRGKL